MKPLLTLCAALILTAPVGGLAAAPAGPVARTSADVSLLAAWIAGADDSKVFDKPLGGDSHYIEEAKDAILYTDVEEVTVPKQLRCVPYEFIKPRMDLINGGHKVDPAVLITRAIAEDPEDGALKAERTVRPKPIPGERYYYVEVAIGNMAWHWMKIRMYEIDGKLKVDFVRSAVS